MTGGLLQIVTSGKQDIYLTINPEITFFKKVYRRHTNFSLELIELTSEQPAEFNNNISFIINKGDALHRCYLEVELPNLSFSDKYITDQRYISKKSTNLSNLNTEYNKWNDYYSNLKNYVDIEIQLYRNLYNLLQTINVSINTLKDEVIRFNYKNKLTKDLYKNKVDESVINLIDISSYITSINKLVTTTTIYDESIYISSNEIIQQLDKMYKIMNEYLSYYNNKKNKYLKQINEQKQSSNGQINFNYSEYLGHNFFEYFSLDIGGIQIQKYENDYLHISQMHKIKEEYMENYLEMIGHTSNLYEFNNKNKGNTKILVPLIFWFNKDAGSSLPIVALQYSNIVINAKIADIKKIICFENYEKMFDDIVKIEIDNNDGFTLNKNLIYNNYTFNTNEKSITYDCLYINNELLSIKFPDLTTQEIKLILENFGTKYTLNQITKISNSKLTDLQIQNINGNNGITEYYLIDKSQWMCLMMNLSDPTYSTIATKIGSYYPYINFNLYYGLINDPKVKLIAEVVFLDDVERAKFANSKLEYVVETINSDIFTIKNQDFYDCELSFINPCKELYWYIQPQLFIDGLTENGQNISLLFDIFKYFNNNPILEQKLTFNQIDLLFNNVDYNYYTNLLSYKYLNNLLPNGIYYNSFSLYPEETQPSGTANLKQIKGKQYRFQFNKLFLKEYVEFLNGLYKSSIQINAKSSFILKFIAKTYDLFVVHKGSAKLVFSS